MRRAYSPIVMALSASLLTAAARSIYAAQAPASGPAIAYRLPAPGNVSLGVYDTKGALVRTLLYGQRQEAGEHTLTWDGLDRNAIPAPAGTYQWRLLAIEGLKAEFLLGLGTSTDARLCGTKFPIAPPGLKTRRVGIGRMRSR